MEMVFGLNRDKFECILGVLNTYSQCIKKVWIFGSKIRGDHKIVSERTRYTWEYERL